MGAHWGKRLFSAFSIQPKSSKNLLISSESSKLRSDLMPSATCECVLPERHNTLMRACWGCECVCVCACVCLRLCAYVSGVMKESRVYIFLRVCTLSLIPEGLFGVFCAGFYSGGGGEFLGSFIQM